MGIARWGLLKKMDIVPGKVLTSRYHGWELMTSQLEPLPPATIFFLTFYFILGYSQLAMMCYFQVDTQGTQPYLTRILSPPDSPPITHNNGQSSLCATAGPRGNHFKYGRVYMLIANSLSLPCILPPSAAIFLNFFTFIFFAIFLLSRA